MRPAWYHHAYSREMRKSINSALAMAAGLALTVAAVAVYPHLPERRMTLTATMPGATFFLMPADAAASATRVDWVNRESWQFICDIAASDKRSSCSFALDLSASPWARDDSPAGQAHGQMMAPASVDLSVYDSLELRFHYAGPSSGVRLAIRNFDPRFSKPEDGNSLKYNNLLLSAAELNGPVTLQLSEFRVPEWWVASYKLPRPLSHPDLTHATTLLVEIPNELQGTRHEFRIDQLDFVGHWVSREHWYLGIIGAWFFGALAYGGFALWRWQQQQRIRIASLRARNDQLASEKDRFRELSTVDALTNTFNRHGIDLILNSLDLRQSALSLVLVDLDHFKAINDQRGHDAGDRVLHQLADVLMSNTRSSSKVGRWGGEEFLLICPDTTAEEAQGLAERLRRLVASAVFEPEQPLNVTASFGVACVHPGEGFAQALKRADMALYAAKAQGRNCVVSGEATDESPAAH